MKGTTSSLSARIFIGYQVRWSTGRAPAPRPPQWPARPPGCAASGAWGSPGDTIHAPRRNGASLRSAISDPCDPLTEMNKKSASLKHREADCTCGGTRQAYPGQQAEQDGQGGNG